MQLFNKLKSWARRLKADLFVLYSAARDPAVPWYAKALIGLVVAYALSPIDLIPDFIPVLGYLDDLLLLPLGIYLAFRLIPTERLAYHRQHARQELVLNRKSWIGATVVLIVWGALLYWAARYFGWLG